MLKFSFPYSVVKDENGMREFYQNSVIDFRNSIEYKTKRKEFKTF